MILILSLFICICLSAVNTVDDYSCGVVKRKEWGAQPPSELEYMTRPVCIVIIAHTVTDECNTREDCESIVRSIQNFHLNTFDDIGYSFLVGGDGQVYEGRGWSRVGAHTYGYNTRSIGIAFIGDFSNKKPSQSAIDVSKKLMECGVSKGHLSKDYKLFGHRQLVALESPGITFFGDVKNWSHWSKDIDSVKDKNTFKCQ